ncbi:hypothetical protein ACFFTR_45190, partial [Dactylosporangium vinaceum]
MLTLDIGDDASRVSAHTTDMHEMNIKKRPAIHSACFDRQCPLRPARRIYGRRRTPYRIVAPSAINPAATQTSEATSVPVTGRLPVPATGVVEMDTEGVGDADAEALSDTDGEGDADAEGEAEGDADAEG